MNIYFLGGGNMAAAIAGGFGQAGRMTASTSPPRRGKTRAFGKRIDVEVSESLPELNSDDVLILAVKPQDMEAACRNVRANGAFGALRGCRFVY